MPEVPEACGRGLLEGKRGIFAYESRSADMGEGFVTACSRHQLPVFSLPSACLHSSCACLFPGARILNGENNKHFRKPHIANLCKNIGTLYTAEQILHLTPLVLKALH